MATTTPKMKLSERVQNRDAKGRFATGFQEPTDQPEVTQEVNQATSSTSAAKVAVERDTNLRTNKLMEAANDIQEDTLDVDKKLLKAVSELTKTMQFGYKRQQEEKKKGLAGFVQGKIANVKKAFTLEGAAGMAGIGRDDGSLKGAVLGSVLQRKEEKAKKAEFIANFGEYTDKGRELRGSGDAAGMKKVTAEGEVRYQMMTKADKDISELEEKQKKAKSFGGDLSESDSKALAEAQYLKKEATAGFSAEKKPKSEKKDELMAGVAAGVTAEISVLSPEEKKTLNKADPEYLKGVFEGALGSLTEVNEKQLDQLVALVKASTMSEEDKLESANKGNMLTSIQDPKEEKKKDEEGGGFLKTITDFMTSKIGGLLKMLPAMLTGALGGLGALFGGAKKPAAPIIDKAKDMFGGAKKALPTIADAGTDAAKKPSLATKALGGIGKVGNLAKGVLGKLGPVAMAGMAAYDAVSGYNEAGANLGIEGREATTGEKMSSAAGSALSGLTFGLVGKDTASKGIKSLFGAGPDAMKTATPNRVAQSGALAASTQDLQTMSDKKEAPAPTVVNSAPTTIINQGGGKAQAPRTPVRNPEVSYNNRLTRYFVG
jgi:hypothetical protein